MKRRLGVAAIAISAILAAGCGSAGTAADASSTPTLLTSTSTSTSTVTSTSPDSSITTTTAPVAPTTVVQEPPLAFVSSVETIADPASEASTWKPGCPVEIADLRVLTLTFWGYDDLAHRGQLVVYHDYAEPVIAVFEQLFDARFPIERMELIDRYGGDDNASMRANNTSAFNCREVDGSPGVWSEHASGAAIDINPLVNPWVRSDGRRVDPPAGERYRDRTLGEPGMIVADDVVTDAFGAVGWAWGGDWAASKDYQHFSAGGSVPA